MNYLLVGRVLGHIMKLEAALLALPLIVSLICRENTAVWFLIPMAVLLLLGTLLTLKKPQNKDLSAREGFAVVALAWITLSLFGSLPFLLSGEVSGFVNALFETVSGFTTTGATVLKDVEAVSRGMLFWRSFTQWIGGMGVLVFVLAILPKTEAPSIYLLKAEFPGPSVGKLVSRLRASSRILYAIYMGLTAVQVIFLLFGGMPLFDSVCSAFSTAGTGGFAVKNASIAFYDSAYIEMVTTAFMIIFGINFQIHYFVLLRNFKQAFKDEELRWYLIILAVVTGIVTINILPMSDSVWQALRHSVFQVSAIMTTTGFTTANFSLWPMLAQGLLLLLMLIGACAGSTSGGMTVSRLIIAVKNSGRELRHILSPRSVNTVKLNGRVVRSDITAGVSAFFIGYFLLILVSALVVALDNFDFTTSLTASVACVSNIGPGLGKIEPMGNYAIFSDRSKIMLMFDMLAGRLELFPMFALFSPMIWRKRG